MSLTRSKPIPQSLKDVHSSPGHLMRRSQQIAVAIFFEEARAFDITPVPQRLEEKGLITRTGDRYAR